MMLRCLCWLGLALVLLFSSDGRASESHDLEHHLSLARQSLAMFRSSAVSADQSPDYVNSLFHYREAMNLFRSLPDRSDHVHSLIEFARLLESQVQWSDAATYYGRAAHLMDQANTKDLALRAEVSARIAYAHLVGEVLSLAIIHARESLQLCAQIRDQQNSCLVAAKRVLADAYFKQSDYAQAASLYQMLAQLDESTYSGSLVVGSRYYFQIRFWLAQLRDKRLSQEQARLALQNLDVIYPQLECVQLADVCRELLNTAVELAMYQGDFEQAQTRNQFALGQRSTYLPLSQRPGREWVLAAQIQLARGDMGTARQSLIMALSDFGDTYAERTIKFKTLALYYQKKGKVKEEIFWLKRASVWALYAARHYRLSDPKTGRVFLAGQSEIFHRLSRLLLDEKRYVEALDILDLYKENQFLDYSGELPNAMRSAAHTEHGMRWKMRYYEDVGKASTLIGRGDWGHLYQLSQQESQVQKSLAMARPSEQNWTASIAIFKRFLDQFDEDFARDYAIVPDEESEELVAQKRAMIKDSRTAMIEYLVSEDKLYLVLLTQEKSIKAHVIDISAQQLGEWVQAHRQAILHKGDTRPIARRLYQVLIHALKPELTRLGIKELMIFPDAALKSLPFAALYDGQHYLVQDFAIKVVNQVEQVEHPKLPSQAIASVFGNTLASEDLSELPAVRAETTALHHLFRNKGMKSELLVDQQFNMASFENAVKQRHHIVHLATHFKHQAQQHEDSYFLTGVQTALSLSKIKSLAQDYSFAELISLSACDTDVSAQTPYGIDAEGIGSILVRRGAKAVLATKWPIHDDGSALLMPRFYRAWLSGLSKAQALQSAQLSLLRMTRAQRSKSVQRGVSLLKSAQHGEAQSRLHPYAHPYYWAGFVLLER